MCFKCHPTDNDKVLKDLKEMINTNTYDFDKWNTTSIDHLFISASGQDGHEAKKLSQEILKKFTNWYIDYKNDRYLPITGLYPMYPQEALTKIIYKLDNVDQLLTKESMIELIDTEIKKAEQYNPKKNRILGFVIGVMIGTGIMAYLIKK
jgi:hypothetical protein